MQVADYVNRLAENPLVRQYADSTQLAGLSGIRERLEGELGALRSDPWSLAVITSGLPVESDRTFDFIDHIQDLRQELREANISLNLPCTIIYFFS